jgi:hypothetical protein
VWPVRLSASPAGPEGTWHCTTGELERLLVDLPTASVPSKASATGDRPVRLTVGVLGDVSRRWRIAPRSTAIALLGACRLDLRAANLSAPVTTITAVAVVGGFDVVVPLGVRVEQSVYGLFCDATNLVPEQDLPPDAPVVRVRLLGVLAGVETKLKFRFETRRGISS